MLSITGRAGTGLDTPSNVASGPLVAQFPIWFTLEEGVRLSSTTSVIDLSDLGYCDKNVLNAACGAADTDTEHEHLFSIPTSLRDVTDTDGFSGHDDSCLGSHQPVHIPDTVVRQGLPD